MKLYVKATISLILFSLVPLYSSTSHGQDSAFVEEDPIDQKDPLNVTSERMVSDRKNKLISFFGSVIARKGTLTVEADEMLVYTDESEKDFEKIEAIGTVTITRDDRVATGDRADYYKAEGKIVLIGSPATLTQGKNIAQGEKVIYYFDRDDMEIIGGKEKRSTVTLFPNDDEEAVEPEKVTPEKVEETTPPSTTVETETEAKEEEYPEPVEAERDDPPEEAVGVENGDPPPEPIAVEKATSASAVAKPVVKRADPPASAPTEVKKTDPVVEKKPTGKYTVQVGSYRKHNEAVEIWKSLRKKGFDSYIIEKKMGGTVWSRIRIGIYKTKTAARRMASRIEKEEKLATLVTTYEKHDEKNDPINE